MDAFLHVKVVLATLLGFSLIQLLRGLSRFIQHPHRDKPFWIHLLWTLYMFFYIINFWWWEFGLERIQSWNFLFYLVLIIYAVLLYLACALLYPDDVKDYNGFEEYFFRRKTWFFGVLALILVVDYFDTLIKGRQHLRDVGLGYVLRTGIFLVGCLIAMKTKNKIFHAFLVIIGIIVLIDYGLRHYFTIS